MNSRELILNYVKFISAANETASNTTSLESRRFPLGNGVGTPLGLQWGRWTLTLLRRDYFIAVQT